MEKILESMKARSEQFTNLEVQVEIIRQQIQDLEKKVPHNQATPRNQNERLEMQVKALKTRLATIQKRAELAGQGRTVFGQQLKTLLDLRKTGEFPAGTGDTMKTTQKWAEGMENEHRERCQRQMDRLKQNWPRADWKYRVAMLGWLGRNITGRYVLIKPGVSVMRWCVRMVKRLS